MLGDGDNSVWMCLRTSEASRIVVLPVRQPTSVLPTAYNPAIGKIRADTKNFGSVSLKELKL